MVLKRNKLEKWFCVQAASELRKMLVSRKFHHTYFDNHSYPHENYHIEERRIKQHMKRKVTDIANAPAQITGEALQTAPRQLVLNILVLTLISLQSTKSKAMGMLPIPGTLEEVRITNEYHLMEKGEYFLLAHNRKENERILILSIRRNLQFLCEYVTGSQMVVQNNPETVPAELHHSACFERLSNC